MVKISNESSGTHFELPSAETRPISCVEFVEGNPLKVLFVSSGNMKKFEITPFIKTQGESLMSENVEVSYFRIKGKGVLGYLKNIAELREFLKKRDYDLIHAHFTLSAWVAVLTFPSQPIVLSLMGTDAFGRLKKFSKMKFYNKYLTLLTWLIQPFVSFVISKSKNIERHVWLKKKSMILPNGVDLGKIDGKRVNFAKELGLDTDKKNILFLGNPDDVNKNFKLLNGIKENLLKSGFNVVNPYPVSHDKVVKLLSTVELLVMCSFKEGSPNVVKEAMASNCKGVFTNAGDVLDLVNGTRGYKVINWDADELEKAIYKVDAMKYCDGRKKIKEMGLDSKIIAKKLKSIYNSLILD
jgi:teichuronic acid biosynthesis glycosyltransferase TuaC